MTSVSFYPNGFITPLSYFKQAQGRATPGSFDGGAYDQEGQVCSNTIQIKASHNHLPNPRSTVSPTSHISERFVYGGMLQNMHFGHCVAESLTRLWSFSLLSDKFSGVAFFNRRPEMPISPFVVDLVSLIIGKKKIIDVKEPTSFDLLAVPAPICGKSNGFLVGHPIVRSSLSHLRFPPGNRRVYVSRSRLSIAKGGFLEESNIEASLSQEGYEIFHPQEHTIQEQIRVYSEASHLIFADGSAIHLYALVATKNQKVFVIWRRKKIAVFQWQLNSFGGPRIFGENAVTKVWLPSTAPESPSRSRVSLDHALLLEQLKAHKFISGSNWDFPDSEQVEVTEEKLLASGFFCSQPTA